MFVEGAAGALVEAAPEEEVSSCLQPVTKAPTVSANSTIRVYSLFIVAVTFTKSQKRTRTFFARFPWKIVCFARWTCAPAVINAPSQSSRSNLPFVIWGENLGFLGSCRQNRGQNFSNGNFITHPEFLRRFSAPEYYRPRAQVSPGLLRNRAAPAHGSFAIP